MSDVQLEMEGGSAKTISLVIEQARIRAADFKSAVSKFFALLEAMTDALMDEPDAADWLVGVKQGSMRIVASPVARHEASRDISLLPRRIVTTLNAIGRKHQGPSALDWEAFDRYEELASLTSAAHSIDQMRLVGDGVTHRIEPDYRHKPGVAELRRQLQESHKHLEYGSVTGVLETISVHRVNTCTIYDDLTHHAVRCRFSNSLPEDVQSALNRRISIRGQLLFNSAHLVRAVYVQNYYIIPHQSQLPSYKDIQGIFREMRNG